MKLLRLLLLFSLLSATSTLRADLLSMSAPVGVVTAFSFGDSSGDLINERAVIFTAQAVNVSFSFTSWARSFETSTPGIFPDSFRITANTDFNADGYDDEAVFADNSLGGAMDFYGEFGWRLSGSVVDNLGSTDPYTAQGSFSLVGLPGTSPTTMYFTLLNDDTGFPSEASVTVEPVQRVPESAAMWEPAIAFVAVLWAASRRRRASYS